VVAAALAVVATGGALLPSAAGAAPAYPAASIGHTIEASAYPATQAASDISGPAIITCFITVSLPSKTLPPERVGGSASVICDYPVVSIELTEHVRIAGSNVDMAVDHVLVSGVSSTGTVALSASCAPSWTTFTNSAIAFIEFPAGYTPQSGSISDSASSSFGLSDCGIRVAVPGVVGLLKTAAINNITAAGLVAVPSVVTVHESIDSGRVVSQFPVAGSQAIPGSTVNISIGQWDGSHL